MEKIHPYAIYLRIFLFFVLITVIYFDFQIFLGQFFSRNQFLLLNQQELIPQLTIHILILITIFLTLYFFIRLEKRTFKDLGLNYHKNTTFLFGLGVFIAVIGLIISVILEVGTGMAFVGTGNITSSQPLVFVFGRIANPIIVVSLIFLSFIGVGLVEETAFRGYIQKRLKKVTNFPVALLITSFLFGVLHCVVFITIGPIVGLIGLFTAFLGGLAFGYAYEVTEENLAFPIALHGTWNTTLGIIGIKMIYEVPNIWQNLRIEDKIIVLLWEFIATLLGLGAICFLIYMIWKNFPEKLASLTESSTPDSE